MLTFLKAIWCEEDIDFDDIVFAVFFIIIIVFAEVPLFRLRKVEGLL